MKAKDLQLCTSNPTNLDAARAVLRDASTLPGMNHRVTIGRFNTSRRPQIRTIPVATAVGGHLDIRANGGSHRYLITGRGTVELHLTSPSGTIVDVVEACTVTIAAARDIAVDVNAHAGTITILAEPTTRGAVNLYRRATLTGSRLGGLALTRVERRIVLPDHEPLRKLIAQSAKAFTRSR